MTEDICRACQSLLNRFIPEKIQVIIQGESKIQCLSIKNHSAKDNGNSGYIRSWRGDRLLMALTGRGRSFMNFQNKSLKREGTKNADRYQ